MASPFPFTVGENIDLGAECRTTDEGVDLRLFLNGLPTIEATDTTDPWPAGIIEISGGLTGSALERDGFSPFNIFWDSIRIETATPPGGSTASTSGGVTPSTAPGGSTALTAGAFPTPSGSVPADWVQLVDDTQAITIAVPSAWTSIDTTPSTNIGDGSVAPWISASTDAAAFEDSYDVPGVSFRARAFAADTADFASSIADVNCTDGGVQTYDDGLFVGHVHTFTNCDGTATTNVYVVANLPGDTTHTFVLVVQLTGAADDAQTLDGLLSSFNYTAGSTTATTSPGSPTTTTTT